MNHDQHITETPKIVQGEYAVDHLSPDPAQIDKFMPIWNEALAASEAGNQAREQELLLSLRPYQVMNRREVFSNLVTNVGKNDLLDKYLKGTAYTQTLRMGLKGAGAAAAGDTQASHAGWTERGGANAPAFTGNRKDVTMNAAAGQASSSPVQAFAITSAGTVDGCFMNNGGSATKDDTTGVLFSAGDFSNGVATVANLDTLNVTYTLTAA